MGVRHHLPIKSDVWISISSLYLKWRDIREQKNILEPFGFVSFRSTLGWEKQTKSSQQLLPTILNDCSLITTGNITHLSHKPMGIKQRGGRQWKKSIFAFKLFVQRTTILPRKRTKSVACCGKVLLFRWLINKGIVAVETGRYWPVLLLCIKFLCCSFRRRKDAWSLWDLSTRTLISSVVTEGSASQSWRALSPDRIPLGLRILPLEFGETQTLKP